MLSLDKYRTVNADRSNQWCQIHGQIIPLNVSQLGILNQPAMVERFPQFPEMLVSVDAVRHDCGSKAGFVLANLAMGLEDEEIAGAIRDYLGRTA